MGIGPVLTSGSIHSGLIKLPDTNSNFPDSITAKNFMNLARKLHHDQISKFHQHEIAI